MKSAERIMSDRDHAKRERSVLRRALPYFNLSLALGLIFGFMGVTRRTIDQVQDASAFEIELERTRSRLDRIQAESDDRIGDLARLTQDEQVHRREDLAAYQRLIGEMESRLERMESQAREENVQTTTAFRAELSNLKERIEREMSDRPTPTEEVFRRFENDHRRGVVLIYTEFDYYKTRDGENAKAKTVSGWGSGFFLTDEGHIVTNKHVVQPWKFDADLAAMAALGEIRIDESSLRVAVWESGSRALDRKGEPHLATAYNTSDKKNLRILVQAPDVMTERDMDLGAYGPRYEVHALNNNDLVLLKADGKSFHALPLRRNSDGLRKLDPVMALGFPRGQNGLEGEIAETSPSIGTIRKAEETIHVTTSIIPGNSGGPLVGPTGEVVGIVTRVYSETLGICIKIEHAYALLAEARRLESEKSAPAGLAAAHR